MKNGVVNPEQIDRTLEFWRKRTPRHLTNERGRQITVNITRFFEILAEWEERDRKPPQSETSAPQVKKRA
jgi:hypothetical protein